MKYIIPIMVTLLLLSSGFVGVSNTIEKSSIVSFDGKTLYVGGSGEENYSKIQDAIDNASDGDTVFVYGNSSPYYEHVKVNKSINLIGEDKNTTIIDGSKWIDVVSVSADFVNINGFTVQNSGNYNLYDSGIKIQSKYCNISDNLLENNKIGIVLYSFHHNIIYNNNFSNCYNSALWIEHSNNNIITNNDIFSCLSSTPVPTGIYLDSSCNNTISENKISIYLVRNTCQNSIENITRNTFLKAYLSVMQLSDSDWFKSYTEPMGMSIWIFGGSNNTISGNYLCSACPLMLINTSYAIASGNNMVFSGIGILHWANHNIRIIRNNFIKNLSRNITGYTFYLGFDLSDDLWDGNYWNRPRLLPKPIFGIKIIKIRENKKLPLMFPRIKFDWHPAQKPYDL